MKSDIKVALKYILLASLWILFSDALALFISENLSQMRYFSTLKGLAFVLTTGIFLFYWVKKELKQKIIIIANLNNEVEIREQLIRELHHRVKNNLQVVLGLINITTRENNEFEEIRIKITNQLHAMISVFNIVYDYEDFKNISLQNVLNEYKRICMWDFEVIVNNEDIKFSIESMTSILLLLNTILELLAEQLDELHVFIEINNKYEITLRISNFSETIFQLLEEDDIIIAMLKSINGKLKFNREYIIIELPSDSNLKIASTR